MTQPADRLHKSPDALSPEATERHRAIVSLIEELEAVDWYDQRVDACTDDELRSILEHNRDEEKEHAAMLLEWLRKHDSKLDAHLKSYLFRNAAPTQLDAHHANQDERTSGRADQSLGIGSLRRTVEAP